MRERNMLRWLQRQSLPTRLEAVRRLGAVKVSYAFEAEGWRASVAVVFAARECGVSCRTLWRWRAMVGGVRRNASIEQLWNLCPRRWARS